MHIETNCLAIMKINDVNFKILQHRKTITGIKSL